MDRQDHTGPHGGGVKLGAHTIALFLCVQVRSEKEPLAAPTPAVVIARSEAAASFRSHRPCCRLTYYSVYTYGGSGGYPAGLGTAWRFFYNRVYRTTVRVVQVVYRRTSKLKIHNVIIPSSCERTALLAQTTRLLISVLYFGKKRKIKNGTAVVYGSYNS